MRKRKIIKLKFDVATAAVKVGIHNANQLSERTGLNGGKANRLWKGLVTKIDLNDLEVLMNTLPCRSINELIKVSHISPESN